MSKSLVKVIFLKSNTNDYKIYELFWEAYNWHSQILLFYPDAHQELAELNTKQ